jgi:hypothetical protein
VSRSLTAGPGRMVEEGGNLRLDGMGQKGTSTAAQHLGKRPWLGKLENVTLGHGVSLLQWRSGGSNTPTIRRLTPSRRHQLPRIALWGMSVHAACQKQHPQR